MPVSIPRAAIAAFLLVCIVCIQESVGQKNDARCGQWQFGACEKLNKNGGKCGRGTKKATRSGDIGSCSPLEKNVPCKVPCGAGEKKKVCKYRKGQWSECDASTLKRSRTDTLMSELSDPTCDSTRPFEKACKKKLCEYGPWSAYGPCQSGQQTRTRAILSGTQEHCQAKAKKTKRCTGGGRGGGGGGGGGHGGKNKKTKNQ